MIIGVDVDGVCADLHSEWLRRYNRDYQDTLSPEGLTQERWIPYLLKPECGYKILDYLREPDLYDSIEPIPGALAGVTRLRSQYDVIFVSSCVYQGADTKTRWLVQRGFLPLDNDGIGISAFIAADRKSLVRVDVLIDDSSRNARAMEKVGVPTIVLDKPYNQSYVTTRRAHNWDDIIKYVVTLNL